LEPTAVVAPYLTCARRIVTSLHLFFFDLPVISFAAQFPADEGSFVGFFF